MAKYIVPKSSSIWENPDISLHLDDEGKPLIFNANLSKMEIALMVRFEVSNGERKVNHNWLCDQIKVDSFEYDPAGTMAKFATRLADFEVE